MKSYRTERTGWRDKELSDRHGCWGFNCPAVDLDFVMTEFNHGKPCAVVEYKRCTAKPPETSHSTYRALVALADGFHRCENGEWLHDPLPCFIAIYDPDGWAFFVIPLNEKARKFYAHCSGQWISEQRFVRSLHLLRKSVLNAEDEAAIRQLNVAVRLRESA